MMRRSMFLVSFTIDLHSSWHILTKFNSMIWWWLLAAVHCNRLLFRLKTWLIVSGSLEDLEAYGEKAGSVQGSTFLVGTWGVKCEVVIGGIYSRTDEFLCVLSHMASIRGWNFVERVLPKIRHLTADDGLDEDGQKTRYAPLLGLTRAYVVVLYPPPPSTKGV